MYRILLIDDDRQLGGPLATYFQRFELALTQALKPSDALALLRGPGVHGGFDAAILDVMLPAIWHTAAMACHQGRRLPTRRANSQLPRSAADMAQNKGGIPKVAPTAPNNNGMTV